MLAASAAGVCQACKDPRFKKNAGIVEAFAQHSCNIGSGAAFARVTAEATSIQFDEDWHAHVTQQVACFASMPAGTEHGGITELDCDVSLGRGGLGGHAYLEERQGWLPY